ncbi:MAG TPA: glycoside hydrolase family 3 C-terminal domain-containing protein, partial [Lacunisphaera sp.]|nr:glycoside hydrolase family 3 C-terminal domain-containing protein [Lacunisphaera sp.]
GHVPAIVYAWEPGSKGGQAIAEALFGVINPGGRLPMSFPRHAGHIPVAYNLKPPLYYRKYTLGPTGPLFSFGHGLSYTTFRYSNLQAPTRIAPGADLTFSVDVTNTGTREGDEIVLAYVNDVVASVTVPVRELQAYQRLTLAPGETRTVALVIPPDQLALYNRQMQRVVEPGDFDLFVGPLTARFTILP